MKRLTGKRAHRYIEMYERATAKALYEVYGRWSHAKVLALSECYGIMAREGGYDGRIISHNQMQFTFAITKPLKSGRDLYVITKENVYVIDYLPF